jgi:hypothetical protein
MGAWGVLGHVAGGYNDAHEKDLQRQFEDEQNKRSQYASFLQKMAFDENVHPDVRNKAIGELQSLPGQPLTKPLKTKPLEYFQAPNPSKAMAGYTPPPVPGGSLQNLVPPPAPPGGIPQGPNGIDASTLTAPGPMGSAATTGTAASIGPSAQMGPPPPPVSLPASQPSQVALMQDQAPSTFKMPEQIAAEQAARTAAITGAQGASTLHALQPTYAPDGSVTMVPVSGDVNQKPITNAVPPLGILRSQFAGKTIQATGALIRTDPELAPLFASSGLPADGLYDIQFDKMGRPIKFVPTAPTGTLPTSTSEHMNAGGEVTRHKTTGLPSGPPAPPGGSAASSAAQSPQGGGAKGTGSGAGAGSGTGKHVSTATVANWQDDKSPVAGLARDWAVLGKAPKGGPMAERQVRAYMQAHGMEPSLPVPPALQDKIQQAFVARNSAIGLIDDVMKNSDVLSSLISAGKISIASDPEGNGVLTRIASLNDKEAQVAGDFSQLVEHANLLRGPLGATGFRGKEAWAALQAQRGTPMGDPRITRQQLAGMRQRLVGLNSADKMIISGQGMTMPDEQAQQTPPAVPGAKKQAYKIGTKWYDAATHQEIQ